METLPPTGAAEYRTRHHVKPTDAETNSLVYVVTLTEGRATDLHTETVIEAHRAALRVPSGLYATIDGYRLGGHEPTDRHNKVIAPDEAHAIMRELATQLERSLQYVRQRANRHDRMSAADINAAA